MSTPPDTDGYDSKAESPHEQFAESTVKDREIAENNFGAGVYKNAEVYEQTRRFKRTLNAHAGIGQSIERLALGEAYQTIGCDGWRVEADDETKEIPAYEEAKDTEYEEQRRRAEQAADGSPELEYGREVFATLPDYLQTHAMTELSTLRTRFDPPEMRVSKFFHEASRSKGGRLMDNVFGRVKKLISEGDGQSKGKKRRLFGGGER